MVLDGDMYRTIRGGSAHLGSETNFSAGGASPTRPRVSFDVASSHDSMSGITDMSYLEVAVDQGGANDGFGMYANTGAMTNAGPPGFLPGAMPGGATPYQLAGSGADHYNTTHNTLFRKPKSRPQADLGFDFLDNLEFDQFDAVMY